MAVRWAITGVDVPPSHLTSPTPCAPAVATRYWSRPNTLLSSPIYPGFVGAARANPGFPKALNPWAYTAPSTSSSPMRPGCCHSGYTCGTRLAVSRLTARARRFAPRCIPTARHLGNWNWSAAWWMRSTYNGPGRWIPSPFNPDKRVRCLRCSN
ncbi:MAG: hypothetical protein BWY72_01133 [Bacteroidetes bacterium ADurb.Bin416]|nr:MAG: hypothetical protein BWY72_01133 [Bacteroidetes bacterium ADurb.Bin416]